MTMVSLLLFGTFAAGLGIGLPIAVAIFLSSLVVMLVLDLPFSLLAHQMLTAIDSYTLIAIPGFMLCGALMEKSGLVQRLVDFSMALVGWVRGGLSYVALTATIIFAGISGSGTADTAAVGSIMIPALQKDRYDSGYAAAVVASGGSIGIIIPPSIPMIIYGVTTNTSIPALFIGGYLPGIVLALALSIYMYWVARREGYGTMTTFSPSRLATSFRRAFWALLAPVVIVGGIVGGVVTPTEAAIIGVMYILVIGLCVYRDLTVQDLVSAFVEAAVLTGVIMFLLATSSLFGWIMARENIPDMMVSAILSVTSDKFAILLGLNVLLLALGCIMDTIAILVILTPLLMPVAAQLGVDPVHFGITIVFNLSVGLLTPPVGYALFVASSIARTSVGQVTRAVLPLLAIKIVVLLLITYVPVITMFLPNLLRAAR